MIADTDYLLMNDYPISEEDLAVVKAYRTALRDVPQQEGFPYEVVWPEVPAAFKRMNG
ncbi:MAG: tail fiber assembly protein [Sutterella wadsworthensis]|nr:tail fiber assembly protein [Sutterella wadsworthensis]